MSMLCDPTELMPSQAVLMRHSPGSRKLRGNETLEHFVREIKRQERRSPDRRGNLPELAPCDTPEVAPCSLLVRGLKKLFKR